MTFPFLSDRNPLWTPSNLTSRHFVFQNNGPAMFCTPRCNLPPPQTTVYCLFKFIVNCVFGIYTQESAGACVCVYTFRIIFPGKVLRYGNTFTTIIFSQWYTHNYFDCRFSGSVYSNMKPLSMNPVEASVYENCAFEPDDAQRAKKKVSKHLFLSFLGYRVTWKSTDEIIMYHVTGRQVEAKRKHCDLWYYKC